MSPAAFVMQLARGEGYADGPLLPACRLDAGSGESYGVEAIIASFRRAPLAFAAQDDRIETSRHLALFHFSREDQGSALFADLHDGRIARLWRLSPRVPAEVERHISVPFSCDLTREQPSGVHFSPSEHPDLDAGAANHIMNTARMYARSNAPGERTRCFVLRAFSCSDRAAALIACFRSRDEGVRTAGFSYAGAALRFSGDRLLQSRVISDSCGEGCNADSSWTPRL